MESIADQIAAALVRGQSAATPLGVFWAKTYPGYAGRNPRTGEVIPVPDKKLPMFALDPDFLRAALGADGLSLEVHQVAERLLADPRGHKHVLADADQLRAVIDEYDDGDDPDAHPTAPPADLVTLSGPSRADAAALLAAGKPANFPSLGRLVRRKLSAGPCRGRTYVEFIPSQVLKDRINGNDVGR